jgi:CDP-diacylglycerol--glycerol-3-phosphate 3-phosphatidyltransferase
MKKPLLTISNTLSFIRAPLAFLFLQDNAIVRVVAIVLAMFTDSIDGYLARRSRSTSRFGAILDPSMDKFFVYFALIVFYFEGCLHMLEVVVMLSRDFFLLFYASVMFIRQKSITLRAIRSGKVTTALQFFILIALALGISVSWMIYGAFLVLGFLAYCELLVTGRCRVE